MKNIKAILLLASLAGCINKKPEITGLEGKSLPSFNILLADSVTYFNTKNTTAGEPVVLFYFSPRCIYCRAQMGEIIDNIQSLKDIRFYVFTTQPFTEMKTFYEHYRLKRYPNITVGIDYTNFFQNYFKAQNVPYMAIYGKENRLCKVFIGKVFGGLIKEVAEK